MTLILKATEFDKQSAAFRKKYKDVQALYDHGWILQPKYDGVFALITIRPDRRDSSVITRTGEPIRSCDHILDALHAHRPTRVGYVVLAELWAPGTPFPTISGWARQHRPAPELIAVLHDRLPATLETAQGYSERLCHLREVFGSAASTAFRVIEAVPRRAVKDVPRFAQELVAAGGYDGAMLKDPWAPYVIKVARDGEIVKVKPTLSLDLPVVERLVAEGEKTGRDVFTLVVEYRGVKTTVGSGVPHNISDVPNAGDIVEVECLGVTADGKLREPRFKGVKFDKTEGDQ